MIISAKSKMNLEIENYDLFGTKRYICNIEAWLTVRHLVTLDVTYFNSLKISFINKRKFVTHRATG